MIARIIDLRYKMKEVLKALDRRETVTILSHGKVKGTIYPVRTQNGKSVKDHPFFGMKRKESRSVQEELDTLREERYHAV
jgi:antitoxin (DNA-binding transcriptional repressor) of toxin-antitoxin stability system